MFSGWFITAQNNVRWDTVLPLGHSLASELVTLDQGYLNLVQGVDRRELHVWEWDLLGRIVDSQSYSFDNVFEGCSDCLDFCSSKGFIHAHTALDSNGSFGIRLVKFARDLDTVKTSIYRFKDSLNSRILSAKVYKLVVDRNRIYVTGYVGRPQSQFDLLIAVFDTNLNLIAENKVIRNFTTGGYWGTDLELMSNGDLLLSGLTTYYPSLTIKDNGAFLARTDSLGRLKWLKPFNINGVHDGSNIFISKINDSTIAFSGTVEYLIDLFQLRIGISDTSGNVLLDTLVGKRYSELGLEDMDILEDGSFLLTQIVFENQGFKGKASKMSPQAEIIWDRIYFKGDVNDASEFFTGTFSKDSGAVICGHYLDLANNPTNQFLYYWIAKLDKNGCLADSCATIGQHESLELDFLRVYPNPATESITINIPSGSLSLVRIMNMQGEELIKVHIESNPYSIDISELSSGLYLIHVHSIEGSATFRLVRK